MSENVSKSPFEELTLSGLATVVWNRRKVVYKVTLLFVVLGIVVALVSPKRFSATSTFIPQMGESPGSQGALGGLASLAGFNLSGVSGSSDVPPALYPKIALSVSFQKALLNAKIHVDALDSAISYQEYYDQLYSPGVMEYVKDFTVGLPGKVVKALKGEPEAVLVQEINGIVRVSQEEYTHFKRLNAQLKVIPNEKDGIVTVHFEMPEPLMAAEMTKFSVDLLQEEVIQFKIKNAKEQLRFTEERFLERKEEFEDAQMKLANFKDRNQNLSSAYAISQLQQLEANYNFYFDVYTELAKQVEQAKLQVAKDTQVFSILQPVTLPIEKSNIRGSLVLIIFSMIGFSFSIVYILASEYFKRLK
ncbi:exopolysaccharide biosynthesis protein [Algoriphagus aestuariicola]|jgi:uncharacterized protein involved in exopolysaccharide biosynthesis|uniref:Exopolysaccharide biosynthesis protein n=1 Tax=Algoriphagus aestuariicola TaxID=1852016 RepID=A0ABS3BKQ3_9BACT|nr:Wzz/FepE/Etk N-terminal domain-containing protein [Algoriphagus aestuariicola]MBN7799888.1 exopolysaccharide biosynthesis protein [Algoriphagus aestuariicola]